MSKKDKDNRVATTPAAAPKFPDASNGIVAANVTVTDPIHAFEEDNQLYGGISPVVQAHLDTVNNYVAYMSPNVQVSETDGVAWQHQLFKVMLTICSFENVKDMVDGMDKLLMMFKTYSEGALNMLYTQRFTDKMVVTETDRDLFTNLCYVFSIFSNEEKREAIGRQIQLTGDGNVLTGMDQEVQSRLVQYLYRLFV